MMDEWDAKYLGEFKVDERTEQLYRAGLEYDYHCELYDSLTCHAVSKRGIATPVTPWEHQLVNRHARKTKRLIEEKYCMKPGEFQEAMQLYFNRHPQGMTPDLQRRIREERERNEDPFKYDHGQGAGGEAEATWLPADGEGHQADGEGGSPSIPHLGPAGERQEEEK